MSVGLGAVAVLGAEQNAPGVNITSFGDALWWASTTVTTVGYGDRYPVTTDGRLIAVALVLVGIGMVGALTAWRRPGWSRGFSESATALADRCNAFLGRPAVRRTSDHAHLDVQQDEPRGVEVTLKRGMKGRRSGLQSPTVKITVGERGGCFLGQERPARLRDHVSRTAAIRDRYLFFREV